MSTNRGKRRTALIILVLLLCCANIFLARLYEKRYREKGDPFTTTVAINEDGTLDVIRTTPKEDEGGWDNDDYMALFFACGAVYNMVAVGVYSVALLRDKNIMIQQREVAESFGILFVISALSVLGGFKLLDRGENMLRILAMMTAVSGAIICFRLEYLANKQTALLPVQEKIDEKPGKKLEQELEAEENERWFREHTRGVR